MISNSRVAGHAWLFMAMSGFGGVFSAGLSAAQDNPLTPAFEVASIKVNDSMTNGGGNLISPGRVSIENRTMKYMVEQAFGLQRYQVTGAPAWMTSDHYDIVAKTDFAANWSQMRLMLQSLLLDRLKLRVGVPKAQ